MNSKKFNLKIQSRPLRLLFLVENLHDFENAIKLYSHCWGGIANSIIPFSKSEKSKELIELNKTLKIIDPDYILIPNRTIPENIENLLINFNSELKLMSNEEVDSYINFEEDFKLVTGKGFRSFNWKNLPRITLFFKEKINFKRKLFLFESGGKFDFELMTQNGIPSEKYKSHMIKNLGAEILSKPTNIKELFKISLILSNVLNTSRLTRESTRSYFQGNSRGWLDKSKALCIFLAKPRDWRHACCFWNLRWFQPYNKVFLPRKEFLNDLEDCLKVALKFIPELEAICFFISTNSVKSNELLNRSQDIIRNISSSDIKIQVIYDDFYEYLRPASLYHKNPLVTNQLVATFKDSDEIRFVAESPSILDHEDLLFGFDLEIKDDLGQNILFPREKILSSLLSNSIKTIEHIEKSDSYRMGIEKSVNFVRAASNGFKGVSYVGNESVIYLPPDDFIIKRYIKEISSFKLEDSRPTRYASGFIKLIGGIENIYKLINMGEIEILLSLNSKDAKQSGFELSKIINFLINRIEIDYRKSQNVINQQMPELLKRGLVRRGLSLKCPICDLRDWYSIDKLNEIIECHGCLNEFQIDELEKIKYSYKSNELSVRFIDNGGIAVLNLVDLLAKSYPKTIIHFGGNFLDSQSKNIGEIDLIALAGDIVLVAECKYCPQLDNKKIIEIKKSLIKSLDIAKRIKADILLLSITISSKVNDLMLEELSKFIQKINKNRYKNGFITYLNISKSLLKEPDKNDNIDLNQLILQAAQKKYKSVGNSPFMFSLKESNYYDIAVLEEWANEFISSCEVF